MLASISAATREGILIKGVKYVERLPQPTCRWSIRLARCRRADPQMTDVIPFNGLSSDELLQLTGAFKRHSDHLLAEAGQSAAAERRLPLATAATFEVIPGQGVRACIDGQTVTGGTPRLIPAAANVDLADRISTEVKTLVFVARKPV
jgi:Cu+-exporting ATPase